MSNEELSILKNTIEQMASDADDRGLADFGLRLSVADAFVLCKLEPPPPLDSVQREAAGERWALLGGQ